MDLRTVGNGSKSTTQNANDPLSTELEQVCGELYQVIGELVQKPGWSTVTCCRGRVRRYRNSSCK